MADTCGPVDRVRFDGPANGNRVAFDNCCEPLGGRFWRIPAEPGGFCVRQNRARDFAGPNSKDLPGKSCGWEGVQGPFRTGALVALGPVLVKAPLRV